MKHTHTIKVVVLIIATLVTTVVMGQKYRNSRSYQPSSNKYLVGIESGMGTTNLKFESDIEAFKDLKFYSTGWNIGLMAGDKALKFRISVGDYKYEKSMSESISQKLLSAKINISPVRLFAKVKYFQLYAITGVDYGMFSFKGVAVPKYVNPDAPMAIAGVGVGAGQTCCCEPQETAEPVIDAAELAVEPSNPDLVNPKSLSLKKAQINGGLGAEFSTIKKGKHFRMFAEAYYGAPLKEIINDLSLNKTKLSGQLVVNIGVGFGISR